LDFDNRLFRRNYRDPVLVACTDGVGTKLKVAQIARRHDSIGIDLVAMCVNDAICCGAEPLFFLDYVAMSHDDPQLLEQIVRGISDGCIQADCALLGGETAIMPDLYQHGQYDLAGFCVGVVERQNVIDGTNISADDVVIGIASSGFHSNGYSLIRKAVFEIAGKQVEDIVEDSGLAIGQVLLQPTVIYVNGIRQVLQYYKVKNVVHGIAHITGGGLADNLVRILPPEITVEIDAASWDRPKEFRWLQDIGNIETAEMFRVFNMGIGLALIVSPFYAENIRRILSENGLANWIIGHAQAGPRSVVLNNP
jgi:phosphoribosylformylglycinamidine cyclo-ligase